MRSGASFRDFVIILNSKALFLYPVSLSFVRGKTPYSRALLLDLVVHDELRPQKKFSTGDRT